LTNGVCYDRLSFHDRYALQVLWAQRNVIVIMLITVMVQVCTAAEGAGVSGEGDGARKVIKKPLRLPLRLVSEFRKTGKDKCLTSGYCNVCSARPGVFSV
jgi:hypothetical protein